MQKRYEAPYLTVIGKADHVVMGLTTGGTDNGQIGAPFDIFIITELIHRFRPPTTAAGFLDQALGPLDGEQMARD